MFYRKKNYRWIAGEKTVTACVNIRLKNGSKSNKTINNLHNWINIALIINFWLKLGSFQTCKSLNFQNKKFNWPVTSRFFTRHKRKKIFFWSVVSSVKVSVKNLLCSQMGGNFRNVYPLGSCEKHFLAYFQRVFRKHQKTFIQVLDLYSAINIYPLITSEFLTGERRMTLCMWGFPHFIQRVSLWQLTTPRHTNTFTHTLKNFFTLSSSFKQNSHTLNFLVN